MIGFNSGSGIQIFCNWYNFKNIITSKQISIQYAENSEGYVIFAIDSIVIYITKIYKNNLPKFVNVLNGDPSSEDENTESLEDFENNFKSEANKPLIPPKDPLGIPLTVSEPRRGTELIIVSHNYCDPCTWYTESIRVNEEILTSEDGYTWNSVNPYWIDMVSGRMFKDYKTRELVDHKYDIVLTVDGYSKLYRDYFSETGGDFSIFYEDGYIKSFEDWSGKEIKCSYSYATGSAWSINPDFGTKIDIEQADVQFSSDVMMNDTVIFETLVYNPEDFPNKIVYDTAYYKRVQNIIDEAIGAFPTISKLSPNARGTKYDTVEFPFKYGTVKTLDSSVGLELRIRLENNIKYGGSFCTASFYCTVK
jgi:hypothetical protein